METSDPPAAVVESREIDEDGDHESEYSTAVGPESEDTNAERVGLARFQLRRLEGQLSVRIPPEGRLRQRFSAQWQCKKWKSRHCVLDRRQCFDRSGGAGHSRSEGHVWVLRIQKPRGDGVDVRADVHIGPRTEVSTCEEHVAGTVVYRFDVGINVDARGGGPVFNFYASDQDTRAEWVVAIQAVIAAATTEEGDQKDYSVCKLAENTIDEPVVVVESAIDADSGSNMSARTANGHPPSPESPPTDPHPDPDPHETLLSAAARIYDHLLACQDVEIWLQDVHGCSSAVLCEMVEARVVNLSDITDTSRQQPESETAVVAIGHAADVTDMPLLLNGVKLPLWTALLLSAKLSSHNAGLAFLESTCSGDVANVVLQFRLGGYSTPVLALRTGVASLDVLTWLIPRCKRVLPDFMINDVCRDRPSFAHYLAASETFLSVELLELCDPSAEVLSAAYNSYPGKTPLHVAAGNPFASGDAVDWMLHVANPGAALVCSDEQWTALHYAVCGTKRHDTDGDDGKERCTPGSPGAVLNVLRHSIEDDSCALQMLHLLQEEIGGMREETLIHALHERITNECDGTDVQALRDWRAVVKTLLEWEPTLPLPGGETLLRELVEDAPLLFNGNAMAAEESSLLACHEVLFRHESFYKDRGAIPAVRVHVVGDQISFPSVASQLSGAAEPSTTGAELVHAGVLSRRISISGDDDEDAACAQHRLVCFFNFSDACGRLHFPHKGLHSGGPSIYLVVAPSMETSDAAGVAEWTKRASNALADWSSQVCFVATAGSQVILVVPCHEVSASVREGADTVLRLCAAWRQDVVDADQGSQGVQFSPSPLFCALVPALSQSQAQQRKRAEVLDRCVTEAALLTMPANYPAPCEELLLSCIYPMRQRGVIVTTLEHVLQVSVEANVEPLQGAGALHILALLEHLQSTGEILLLLQCSSSPGSSLLVVVDVGQFGSQFVGMALSHRHITEYGGRVESQMRETRRGGLIRQSTFTAALHAAVGTDGADEAVALALAALRRALLDTDWAARFETSTWRGRHSPHFADDGDSLGQESKAREELDGKETTSVWRNETALVWPGYFFAASPSSDRPDFIGSSEVRQLLDEDKETVEFSSQVFTWVRIGCRFDLRAEHVCKDPGRFRRLQARLVKAFSWCLDVLVWADAVVFTARLPTSWTRVLVRHRRHMDQHAYDAVDVVILGTLHGEDQTAFDEQRSHRLSDLLLTIEEILRLEMPPETPDPIELCLCKLRERNPVFSTQLRPDKHMCEKAKHQGCFVMRCGEVLTALETLRESQERNFGKLRCVLDTLRIRDEEIQERIAGVTQYLKLMVTAEADIPTLPVLVADDLPTDKNARLQQWSRSLAKRFQSHTTVRLKFVCPYTGLMGEPGYVLKQPKKSWAAIRGALDLSLRWLFFLGLAGGVSAAVAATAGLALLPVGAAAAHAASQHLNQDSGDASELSEFAQIAHEPIENLLAMLDGGSDEEQVSALLCNRTGVQPPTPLAGTALDRLKGLLKQLDTGLKQDTPRPTQTGLCRVLLNDNRRSPEVVWVHPSYLESHLAANHSTTDDSRSTP